MHAGPSYMRIFWAGIIRQKQNRIGRRKKGREVADFYILSSMFEYMKKNRLFSSMDENIQVSMVFSYTDEYFTGSSLFSKRMVFESDFPRLRKSKFKKK